MTEFPIAPLADSIAAGETYLSDTPALQSHAGTQPDLFLRWNRIPLSSASIDVVVHLHGFSQQGRDMTLAEKVALSGLDLSLRVRPTLAILPRGNWIRHYYYDFPALLSGGIDRLIDYGLQYLAGTAAAALPGAFAMDRLILSAHSGGGMPAVDVISGTHRVPDEFFVFDGLYGRDPAGGAPMQGLEVIDRWLVERLQGEPRRESALRVIYIEQQTGPFSRKVAELVARHLATADPVLAPRLARRYRVEISRVQHSQIARRCMPELLAAANSEFDWWK